MERREGHSKLVMEAGSLKTVDPHPPLRHTHSFDEVLSNEDGLTRRCRCGSHLWEPTTQAGESSFSPHPKELLVIKYAKLWRRAIRANNQSANVTALSHYLQLAIDDLDAAPSPS